jgi:hypothetical protein
MLRKKSGISALLFLAFATTACFGSFALTSKLYNWNASHDDKWVQQGAFLVTGVLLPVYGVAVLADAVIFNSIEFWTGENPVQTAAAEDGRRIAQASQGGETVTLDLKPGDDGTPYLSLIHEVDGEVRNVLTVVREGSETHVLDRDGVMVLRAAHRADGGMAIHRADGSEPVVLAGADVEAFLAGMPTGQATPSLFAATHFPQGWIGAVTAP